MFSEDSATCSDLLHWVRNGGHLPPPAGLAVHSALTAGKEPVCGGFCLGTGLMTVGWGANCCTFNLCRPHPHNTEQLWTEWLQSLWLHSICRHSSSKLSLLLISLPPLHFSKLRCSFVSLQWFHRSTLTVAFLPVSCSCTVSQAQLCCIGWQTKDTSAPV